MASKFRWKRFYDEKLKTNLEDQRAPAERDRDRVLYSSAFHRLAGVTQIVRADEEDIFHTRQQHSYKVAQVGRRLAQHCKKRNPRVARELGLDEEVVEAACLAHDLGHPPFGHVGEKLLDELVVEGGDSDGFEGNAQSFRIVAKLSVRFKDRPGLDLTRATLAACLKYPWLRDTKVKKKREKWSAYRTESEELLFAREKCKDEEQTLEARLMDWADDIAYSVHDLEDFHRCRAIPWEKILGDEPTQARLKSRVVDAWFGAPPKAAESVESAFQKLSENVFEVYASLLESRYDGLRDQRQQLRNMTSSLVGRYVQSTELSDTGVRIDREKELEVRILKQVARDYIISDPPLSAQQYGQNKVIRYLFESFIAEINSKDPKPPSFTPRRFLYLWDLSGGSRARFVADCISSLTEREALALYNRLTGHSSGSVLDPIVR